MSMNQIIRFSGWYSEELCRAHPELIFVFGDNCRGVGRGGQAIIRYEPNAYGVPTKRVGSMSRGSFFSDSNQRDWDAVLKALDGLADLLKGGSLVVIPVNEADMISLGLERARLTTEAPMIYREIVHRIEHFEAQFGAVSAKSADDLPTTG